MTAEEAKQALKEGKKVRQTMWRKDEFIQMSLEIYDEKGICFGPNLFEESVYADDWEIVE